MFRNLISYLILSTYLKLNKEKKSKSATITTDSNFSNTIEGQFTARDLAYSNLLENYVTLTRRRNNLKEFHKWTFFWIIIISCIIGIYLLYSLCRKILGQKDIQVVLDASPLLITAFASFLSTIIVIPKVIAQFLFDTKEDANITDLIKHTQEHDASGRDFFSYAKNANSEHQKQSVTPTPPSLPFIPIDSDHAS